MVQQFLNIKKELSLVVELLSLLPNHLEIAYLREAFEFLKKFDSITDYPDFAHYISDEARIVESELFEKAVMRLARGLSL